MANELMEDIEQLNSESEQLTARLAAATAEQIKLRAEIAKLTDELEQCREGWPEPTSEPEPLPPDYWETAQ